jgi:EmrB/QacA subfamily drug resistance transporter
VTGPAGPDRRLTVALTALAYFMVTLDALVVVTALPSIHRDLGGSLSTLQWTANAYNLAFAAGIITATALGDRLGRRRVYRVGLGIFTAASAACALAPNLGTLIAFRAVQGTGAAIIMPLGLTLITSAFPAERRGSVLGIWGGIAGLGVAAGPLVGGSVTEGLDWHWIFWVNVPIGILAWFGSRFALAESYGPRQRLDIPALVLVSTGIGVFIWGLVQGPGSGWGNPRTVTSLAAGVLLIAAFVGWETRAPEPMIPLSLFRAGTFAAAAATTFLTFAAIYGAVYLTSEFFQLGGGYSPLGTGLRFLPWTATPLVVAPIAGAVFDRVGARRLVLPGLIMQGAGFAWIVYLAHVHSGYRGYILPFVIAGVGLSMTLPSLPSAGLNAVPAASLGRAAGVLNTMQLLGATFGIAIVTVVFNASGSLASPLAIARGYQPALSVAAALSVLGALTALALRRTSAPPGPGDPASSSRDLTGAVRTD